MRELTYAEGRYLHRATGSRNVCTYYGRAICEGWFNNVAEERHGAFLTGEGGCIPKEREGEGRHICMHHAVKAVARPSDLTCGTFYMSWRVLSAIHAVSDPRGILSPMSLRWACKYVSICNEPHGSSAVSLFACQRTDSCCQSARRLLFFVSRSGDKSYRTSRTYSRLEPVAL